MESVKIKDKSAEITVEPISVSVATAAKLLGVSDRNMYDIVNIEGFPAFKIGARTLVSVAGLRRWVENRVALGVQEVR